MLAYFDTFSGAAGDMLVGALIDAGLELERLRDGLSRLAVGGYRITAERVRRGGVSGTKFRVLLDPNVALPERHLADVERILDASPLPTTVTENARRIFRRLADAEARVHGTTPDRIHFHEVGAVDAIVDIVGVCLGLELLGIRRVLCSAVPVGSGSVTAAHGVMPIPAPATAELLRSGGVPIASSPEVGELTTPTGAAVLTTLAESFGPPPPMTLLRVGYGAGDREGRQVPNLLRVLLGSAVVSAQTGAGFPPCGPVVGSAIQGIPHAASAETDTVVLLEANLDDCTGEVLGHCFELLLAAGALDVFATPILMKKNRPGQLLSVLAEPDQVPKLEVLIFEQTSTLGIRRSLLTRSKLTRRHRQVITAYGPVRVKQGWLGERLLTATPEYEDCRRLSASAEVPLREVMAAAAAAARVLPPR